MNDEKLGFRLNCGVAVFNREGKVLICKRPEHTSDKNYYSEAYMWQLPQGGVDPDEDPIEAGYRELYEETNIKKTDLKLVDRLTEPLRYLYPEDIKRMHHRNHVGQEQYWMAAVLMVEDSIIDLVNCPDPSFEDWKWIDFQRIDESVVPFKLEVYRQLKEVFGDWPEKIRTGDY